MLSVAALLGGVALVVWGADLFAEHVGPAAARLGVSAFVLGLLLAGAEPEELATVVTASIREVPGVAFGDVVGANVAVGLVALGAGALVTPLPFGRRVRRYALGAVPLGAVAVAVAWDGRAGRAEGAVLVALYGAYVTAIWRRERRPPVVGEAAEAAERAETRPGGDGRGGRVSTDLLLAVAGVVVLAAGSLVLVEAVKRLTDAEETQTRLGITLIGFATAFEMVVLVVAAARRASPEALEASLAGVVGSFAYNATMTLGSGALARPLRLADPGLLQLPLLCMPAALALTLVLAAPGRRLSRPAGAVLLAVYAAFVAVVLTR